MTRLIATAAASAVIALIPLQSVVAQNNVLGGAFVGGAAGAVIGGAATGKAGGAVAGGVIGAATGAMLGSQLQARPGGYYWYNDSCWVRYGDGSYHRIARRYCY